jgi:two-component system, NtrC family, sensor kinase
LGQLVAGVAHEINNPVNFIYGNLRYVKDYTQCLLNLVHLYQQFYDNPVLDIQEYIKEIELDFLLNDLPKILSSMKVGAERISEIVLSLRNFSRLDEAEKKRVDIHQGLDSTLLILQSRFKDSVDHPGIKVVKNYGDLPLVDCYPGQLNQVFMNIISNAIDALDNYDSKRTIAEIHANPNKITITTEVIETNCVIRIADNGSGITETVKERLFDPFFTTKPVGKGTGLGLSISYQIVVEKHGGTLRCISEPGQGTEFWIEIPLSMNKQAVNCVKSLSFIK